MIAWSKSLLPGRVTLWPLSPSLPLMMNLFYLIKRINKCQRVYEIEQARVEEEGRAHCQGPSVFCTASRSRIQKRWWGQSGWYQRWWLPPKPLCWWHSNGHMLWKSKTRRLKTEPEQPENSDKSWWTCLDVPQQSLQRERGTAQTTTIARASCQRATYRTRSPPHTGSQTSPLSFSGGSEKREAEKHHDPSLLFQMAVLSLEQNDMLEKSGRRRSTQEEEADVISVLGLRGSHWFLGLLWAIFTELTHLRSVLLQQRAVPVIGSVAFIYEVILVQDLTFKQEASLLLNHSCKKVFLCPKHTTTEV